MIWLIGAGGMSVDYAKVLQAQNENFMVIGRGESSAKKFEEKTSKKVVVGGLDSFLETEPKLPSSAIVSVGVEHLYDTTINLLDYSVENILVEKPGGLKLSEIEQLKIRSNNKKSNIYIAYNRRFYSSVLTAQKLIKLEGGVTSFNFELTEWSHVIEKLDKHESVLSRWFLANSSHVADMAFFLGGKPKKITSYTAGMLDWHSSASVFAGAGISEHGAIFNYSANWQSAGRWSVEMLTNENRYIFRPMESLLVQKRGTISQEEVNIDDELDKLFKPGLYKQVEAFLNNDSNELCSIDEQISLFPIYETMASYK